MELVARTGLQLKNNKMGMLFKICISFYSHLSLNFALSFYILLILTKFPKIAYIYKFIPQEKTIKI